MTPIKNIKLLFSFVFLLSFLSYLYLEFNYNKLNENTISLKIDDKTKNILKKNENNFNPNSLIYFASKKIIEVVIISSK